MKIAIIGSNGQLGSDLVKVFAEQGHEVHSINHAHVSVEDLNGLKNALKPLNLDFVLNTAAMHHVEKCEKEPIKSYEVNSLGAANLASVCESLGTKLVHYSTDYVFDGHKQAPYLESDLANPLNVYGITKLAGENFVKSRMEKYYILRVSGLYGHATCRAKGINFVELMLKLGCERDEVRVVNNETLTPTSTLAIAKQTENLLVKGGAYGLYHLSAHGSCSWNRFAKEIFNLRNIRANLAVARPDEFPMKTPRPKFTVMENIRMIDQGLDIMPTWQECLKTYLNMTNS